MSIAFKRRAKKLLLWTMIAMIMVLGAGMGVALGTYYQLSKVLPPDAAIESYRPPVGSKIISSDGVVLAQLAAEYRQPVPYERIPKHMRDAIVAIEDARFYGHNGLDYRGLARAVFVNLAGGETSRQGGSTITQQLARNMFLSQRKKLSRKIKEMLLAVQIERNWTKRQILEAYLNQVYFGAGAYGVEAAAKTYFGKRAEDLTLDEAAMLAGLVQRPSELSPFTAMRRGGNYDSTRARRDVVLDRMFELRFIDRKTRDEAKAQPIRVVPQKRRAVGYLKAKYFVQHVIDELLARGYTEEMLDKTGLTVVTTLNWKMQQRAEQVTREELARIRGRVRTSEIALVCVDPHTGYIRAMVGGVNEPWEKYQFNCATQAYRQPGSTFKMFVYAAALEEGDHPYSSTQAQAIPVRLGNGRYYAPRGGKARGTVSYRTAFAASMNGAAVNVCMRVGPKKVAALAHRMGLKGNLRAYPSLALGASEATPLEMASAFGVLAAGGKYAEPLAIIEVRNQDGEVQDSFRPVVKNVGLKPETLAGMLELTRAVVTGGTGRAASRVPGAHGKTGTAEEHTDAWFVGFTPGLSCAVWTGNRDNTPMAYGAYGGQLCAPIWARFMEKAVELNPNKKSAPKLEPAKRERPRRRTEPREEQDDSPTVRVAICGESGMVAGPGCPSRTTEEFLRGDQPTARCDLHGRRRRSDPDRPEPEVPDPVPPDPAPAGDPTSPPAEPAGEGRGGGLADPRPGTRRNRPPERPARPRQPERPPITVDEPRPITTPPPRP